MADIIRRLSLYILFNILICGLFLSCARTGTSKVDDASPTVSLRLLPSENNPRNSEGAFIKLKDNRIMFIYSRFYGSSRSDFGTSDLVARFSDDDGRTWSTDNKTVVKNEGNVNVMSVSLLRLKSGKIALFYCRKNSMFDCLPYVRFSADEGRTWTEGLPCITDKSGYFVLNNDRVIQLSNGRLLMPVSRHITEPNTKVFNERGVISCYYSDDSGATWTSGKTLENPTGGLNQEPGTVELRDGRVMIFVRSDIGKQLVAYSGDSGISWTPLKPGNITSPIAPASIKRIPSTGDLILIWNHNDGSNPAIKGKRTPLNIAISKDEGRTWIHEKKIWEDPDHRYCYTAMHFEKDAVLLSHVAGKYSDGTRNSITEVTRVKLDWIYK